MGKEAEKIIYGFYNSLFGEMIIAQTEVGICWLGFMVEGRKGDGLSRLRKFFPDADLMRSDTVGNSLGESVINHWRAGLEADLTLDIRGSDFQLSVWHALLKITKGNTRSYADIAQIIGSPKASRAVGSAVGENPVSLIVPCHRVTKKNGDLGHYGWGDDMKRQMLREEGLKV